MTAVFLIKGFGVIAMTLGMFMLGVLVFDSGRASTGSTVFGVVLLVVGAALFFVPDPSHLRSSRRHGG